MTDQAAVYRPSPRPRPAGASTRPVDERKLRVVPADTLQPETAGAEDTPLDHVSAGQDLGGVANDVTTPLQIAGFRTRIGTFLTSARAYWTPPAVFTGQPAALADLAEYAKSAPWTHQQTGIVRTAGVGYYRFVGYPTTVVGRYGEWFAQRPLRLVALLGGTKLLALTGPGDWVVHTVVYPVAQFAGHLFL